MRFNDLGRLPRIGRQEDVGVLVDCARLPAEELPAGGDAHRHARSCGSTCGVRWSRPLRAVPVDGCASREDCKETYSENETAAAA